MLARLGQQRVDHGVVELPRLRLELFPVDRNLDRVDVQIFHGGPTFGSMAGQALELCTCAPNIR